MDILVNRNIRQKRMAVCESCERFEKSTNRCKICGCFMSVKTWMHTNIKGKLVTCPHPKGNKWIK